MDFRTATFTLLNNVNPRPHPAIDDGASCRIPHVIGVRLTVYHPHRAEQELLAKACRVRQLIDMDLSGVFEDVPHLGNFALVTSQRVADCQCDKAAENTSN